MYLFKQIGKERSTTVCQTPDIQLQGRSHNLKNKGMAFLFCCTSTLEPTNKIGFVNSLALLREGYHEGIIHDITSYHQYQPFATNSLVFHCYIRWAKDNVNNPSYGVFTYTYIPNRYKSHHGVGDAVFRSIFCFSPARNGRIAHQPVNGTIPSELVQLFCKIVNGVLRLFDVMRIEQAERETSCF